MSRLNFGIFMAPFHALAGWDPLSSYQRDLEVLQWLDRLGYEEAWIGEHHSAGSEIIPDPMLFIAHAAPQTRHIKLGTGVLSLPYHNPLWTADRALFLDNLTRGRFMLGLGPGALPSDANMVGIEVEEQRFALEEDMDVLMHLLRSEEPLTIDTPRYRLRKAKSQYTAYTDFDIAVAAIASPTGPRIAGKHGVGLISVGATAEAGFDALGMHWDVMEERAAQFGTVADRARWRLVGPMHIAETREKAIEDVAYGLDAWCDYTQKVLAVPHFRAAGETLDERIAWVNETGMGVIGTPDDAIAQIERLQAQSNGGFGTYLIMHNEWARPAEMRRSYELIANHVKPHFQGTSRRFVEAQAVAVGDWDRMEGRVAKAVKDATDRHFTRVEA